MAKLPARLPPTELVRPGLADLLRDWLGGMAESTQRNYRADLADFAAWSGAPDVATALQRLFSLEVPKANAVVLAYRRHLLERPVWHNRHKRGEGTPDRVGVAPATLNRRLAALRSVARVARLTGHFPGEIEVEGQRVVTYRDTAGIGAEGYRKLLDVAEAQLAAARTAAQGRRASRDLALLRCLHDLGLRRAEALSIDLADLEPDHPNGPHVYVTGKWRRDRELWPVSSDAWQAIGAWLEHRGREPGPLFWGRPGRRMALSSCNAALIRIGKLAGLRVAPHGLRHTSITTALDATGGDIRRVQAFSRHRDPKTVMLYDDARAQHPAETQELIRRATQDGRERKP